MSEVALEPGTILAGKYRLGERLGEGGMGAVYRAEHLVLQAPVAIKVIDREIADEATLARFTREAQASAALRSPHVVQILDYGTDGDRPFMVMELLEGETLAQRIKRLKRLDPSDTARVVSHVCRAVAKAHEMGVVHRDLKPDNVFLVRNDESEIAKVLDFGVAKMGTTQLGEFSHTRTGSLLGTPYYMSPEQAQGNKEIDSRSDLWALGVIAFECLTGKRPFSSDGLGDLVLQICIRDIPVPSTKAPVPIGFDSWFEKATRRDPEERFQSAKELADALRDSLGVELRDAALSLPEIVVSSGPISMPPSSRGLNEDARSTAPGRALPDAVTILEEHASADEARARKSDDAEVSTRSIEAADSNSDDASHSGETEPDPPSSRPLEAAPGDTPRADLVSGQTLGQFETVHASVPPRARSKWGRVAAVGSAALALGVLVAVFLLRDRPGFRVGDLDDDPSPAARPTSGAPAAVTASKGNERTSSESPSPRTAAAPRPGPIVHAARSSEEGEAEEPSEESKNLSDESSATTVDAATDGESTGSTQPGEKASTDRPATDQATAAGSTPTSKDASPADAGTSSKDSEEKAPASSPPAKATTPTPSGSQKPKKIEPQPPPSPAPSSSVSESLPESPVEGSSTPASPPAAPSSPPTSPPAGEQSSVPSE